MNTPESKIVWLVENTKAVSVPLYAMKTGMSTGNPWEAKQFESQEEAETYMQLVYRGTPQRGYGPEWKAIEHVFTVSKKENHNEKET